ncbi:(2Fe-2S)-binding protein [Streptomyces sp. TLI_105]|uniref:(2Fe-2S)-binding protein n=1 Tax=Streptomyces sp. TLI_105 TaxID=1881019 RepID=UPI000898C9C5|nr:(2Fe-2S)-binding protein [Streptomyces sp. TLI_105]SEB89797.1 FhuF 2Fe-2S C-terminal domain-containing protein [Streptomyces sp. TLI_105]
MSEAPGSWTAATGTAERHPLAEACALTGTYRRVIAVCDALDARTVDPYAPDDTAALMPDGSELAGDPAVLDAFLVASAARITARHGRAPRRDVAASRALHDYLWSVSLLMSGAWYRDRRVPRISPRDIRVDLTTGAIGIVPCQEFACLPDDPAATTAAARIVRHEEELRAELRAAVVDHVSPLLAAIGPSVRRGPRALWGMVADDLLSGLWYLGRMMHQEEHAVRAATELLPTAIPPFPGGADFRRLTGRDGRRHPTRTRLGCCLYYTIEPERACLTCPRTCDAERLRRLEDED